MLFPTAGTVPLGHCEDESLGLASICVGMDLFGALYSFTGGETTTAFTVLVGFALAYHYGHWNLGWLSFSSRLTSGAGWHSDHEK